MFDDEQAGLAVRVTAAGSKSYLCQFTVNGSKRRVPLGSCDAISLAAAREAAAGIMGERAKGNDVAAERKAVRAATKVKAAHDALTLAVLVDDWAKLHLAGKRPRYATEAVRAIKIGFPKFLNMPAAMIDRRMVVPVVDAMTTDRGPVMAARTVAYAKAAFQWALKRGSLTVNPFMALPVVPTEKRDRVLTDDELLAVWKASDPSTTYGAIVRFLILTGQRREEAAGATWEEISPDLTTWTIPASRAKNGAAHVVPLSAPVRVLLESRHRADGVLFPGRDGVFNGWSASKVRLDTAITEARKKAIAASGGAPATVQPMPDWRVHDLRRTMATGLQRLGVRLEVTEAVLNHVSGSRAGIVGVYQRHDYATEKRAALDAWGQHVVALVEGGAAAGNVVKLAGSGRNRRG